jgi:inner membrane protein
MGLEAVEPAWAWVVAGLALAGLELVAPGAFLIWLGLAAVATGLVVGLRPLPWQAQALLYAVLAAASVGLGWRLARGRRDPDDATSLNRRGHALVGQVFVLDSGIAEGSGRVRVGDSSWRVVGPDSPAGSRVRVTGLDGTSLVVEPA